MTAEDHESLDPLATEKYLSNETVTRSGIASDGGTWEYLALVERGRLSSRLYCPSGPLYTSKAALEEALESLKREARSYLVDYARVEPQGILGPEELSALGLRPAARELRPAALGLRPAARNAQPLDTVSNGRPLDTVSNSRPLDTVSNAQPLDTLIKDVQVNNQGTWELPVSKIRYSLSRLVGKITEKSPQENRTQKMIRVGIVGYGNIGRGVEKAVSAAEDMELRAVFSRRDPESIKLAESSAPVLYIDKAPNMTDEIDVMVLCGGSATDLEEQGPYFAALFNTVDSFDNHARIPEYLAAVNASAKKTTSIISTGWDPGLFSLMRVLFESALPNGATYTFWGRGVSQGHSDAIRRIEGVTHAIQYTVPLEDAINQVRAGLMPELSARQKHLRECYVVAELGADKAEIERAIKTMPNYFADYDTEVHFIEADEFLANHKAMPHGGMVLRSGVTGVSKQGMEFSLKLDSNPEFTGSVMTAYARAAYRLASEGRHGAITALDIPLSYLSASDRTTLIKELL